MYIFPSRSISPRAKRPSPSGRAVTDTSCGRAPQPWVWLLYGGLGLRIWGLGFRV